MRARNPHSPPLLQPAHTTQSAMAAVATPMRARNPHSLPLLQPPHTTQSAMAAVAALSMFPVSSLFVKTSFVFFFSPSVGVPAEIR